MSSQAYEPAENAGDIVELVNAAFKVARSGIDDLVSPADGLEQPRPRHEIADDAKAGKTGRLTVPFVATDKSERLRESEDNRGFEPSSFSRSKSCFPNCSQGYC